MNYYNLNKDGGFQKNNFQISSIEKQSKTVNFIDNLYTSPNKFKIRWHSIDGLNKNFFLKNELDLFEPTKKSSLDIPKVSFQYFQKKLIEKKIKKSDNLNGLQNIPVYAVTNGQNEFLINHSSNTISRDTTSFNKLDFNIENSKKLGFLFLSYEDAEVYLNEILKVDPEGAKQSGLNIQCIAMDFAYQLTKESHSTFDFRFVPDLNEVKNLIHFKNDYIFDKSIGFKSKKKSFKGVPIYIVQVKKIIPEDTIFNKLFSSLDNAFSKFIDIFSLGVEYPIQSINSTINSSDKVFNYIFFEGQMAKKFSKVNDTFLHHYKGDRFFKKSTIFVSNFEDFIEDFENSYQKKTFYNSHRSGLFQMKKNFFFPSNKSAEKVNDFYNQPKVPIFNKGKVFLQLKTKRFVRFLNFFFNSN